MKDLIFKASAVIRNAKRVTAFSGAGISVESNIPPFRGENGLWNTYDPTYLEINYFMQHPRESWQIFKEIFYSFFDQAKPNEAHYALARMEENRLLHAVITQNIDNLHLEAGSKNVHEFHGNSQRLICLNCGQYFAANEISIEQLPPQCSQCGGLVKPDVVFFGEPIPEPARSNSFIEAELSDVFIVIGSTGEVMPAASIPQIAKQNGATIIEINTKESNYTYTVTDIFLKGKAIKMMSDLIKELGIS